MDLQGKKVETRHIQYRKNLNGKFVPTSLFHISHAFYTEELGEQHLRVLKFIDEKWVASGSQIMNNFNLKFSTFKNLIDDLVEYNLLVEKKILDYETVVESYYKLTYNAADVVRDMRANVLGFSANIQQWVNIAENGKEKYKSTYDDLTI